jgi:phenylacetate-CoA ligase
MNHLRSNIEGVNWPPVLTGPSAALAALLNQIELAQWLPPEQIVQRQLEQLVALASHANRYSEVFRNRMQQAQLQPEDLDSLDKLRQLPLLMRRDIQTSGKSLFCKNVPKTHLPTQETRTSGSTGEPVMVYKTAITHLFWLALTMREQLWQQFDFSGRLFLIRANIREPVVQKDWGPPASILFRTGLMQGIPSAMDIREQLKRILEFKPTGICTYPNVVGGLMAQCEQSHARIEGLEFIWTVGETLSLALRQRLESFFGVAIHDNYSSQEVGVIAVQCPVGRCYHVMSESLIVEVIDDNGQPCREGEVGRVVVTDLHNLATPLIRYAIGDYAEMGGACPCGRGLLALKRIVGRERNLVVKPDGSRSWPLTGFRKFRSIAPILQYQFIQHSVQMIEVWLVTERPLTNTEEELLRAPILEALGYPFTLNFTYFDEQLPLGKNGKFEEFLCRI